MPRTTRLFVFSAVAGAIAGTGVLVAPGASAADPTTSVTLVLAAPDPSGLARLAHTSGLSHTERVRRLATLVPSERTVRNVTSVLATDGLKVTDSTAWTLTANGPESAVSRAFGARLSGILHPTLAQLRLETGPLPLLPANLRSSVIAAFPTTGGPAAFHHSDAVALNGVDFRNAYTQPSVSPPGAGTADDGDAVVATLQLSSYNNADLTAYAAKQSPALPNIVGTPKYHEVKVDGGSTDSSGDIEVDLDQESILSTAPSAGQRPYFAPNTDAGFNHVFASAFDDVTQDKHATDGGDPHIVALSTSWGECETLTTATGVKAAETVIQALTAAGVTVFDASGDDGIYDCGDPTMTGLGNTSPDVDYPASSPEVVSVGGTNLQYTGTASAPNDGTNWKESSWTCTDSVSCQSSVPPTLPVLPGGTGGTGGGASGSAYSSSTANSFKGFSAPAYQSQTITTSPFKGAKKRLVPDIAADGDPDTGFNLVTSDTQYAAYEDDNGYVQVGGTSLSSPLSAALFANELATSEIAAGKPVVGVGDIHGALYSAYAAKPSAFRDITQGSNGAESDKGLDPSVTAQAGYDTNSGVGAALWPALTSFLLSTDKPTISVEADPKNLHSSSGYTKLRIHYAAAQGGDPILLQSAHLKVRVLTSKTAMYSKTVSDPVGTLVLNGKPGTPYHVSFSAKDLSGHIARTVLLVRVPLDDKSFSFHGKWERGKSHLNIAGSHAGTGVKKAFAGFKAKGRVYRVVAETGPKRGKLGVYRHGKLLKTLNLYSAATGTKTFRIFGTATTRAATRGFRLVCLGKKANASRGTRVTVDGVYVS